MQKRGTFRKAARRSFAKDSMRAVMTRGKIAGEIVETWACVETRESKA